ncbi:MAG: FtsX-like permease family protein [Pseudomonadota bacterium]
MRGSQSVWLILRCSLRYWRRHQWQAILMLVGLALGVAVVFSVDIANHSAKRAFALSLDAVTGRTTHQIISGSGAVDESVYTHLRRELGFRQSAPVVEGAVTLQGANTRETLQLLGIDLFAEPMFRTQLDTLTGGQSDGVSSRQRLALLQVGSVMVGQGTAERIGVVPGDTVLAVAGDITRELTVVNIIDTSEQAAFDSLAMTDIATAQWLLQMPGQLSRIDLIVDNQAQLNNIKAAFNDVSAIDATRRDNSLQQMTQAFHTNLIAMSLLALLVGAFLIYNTVTLSVLQRRTLFGQLRVAGVDRQALAIAMVVEVLLFALAGIAVGLLVGYLLGDVLLHLVTRTINDLYFTLEVRRLDVSVITALKVAGMALLAAMVAVAVPAREAANSPPVTLTQGSALESKTYRLLPMLATAGVAGGVAGLVVLWQSVSLPLAFVGLFLFVIGYSLIIPFCLLWLVQLTQRLPFVGSGVTGHYPVRSLSASLSRTAVAVTALAVAVSATAGVGIMIGSFRASVADWLQQTLQADYYVRDSESLGNALPEAFLTALNNIPHVQGVRLTRLFDVEADGVPARLMALQFNGQVQRGLSFVGEDSRTTADHWRRWTQADAVFISEPFAFQRSLATGDKLSVLTAGGLRDLTIAGVFSDYGAGRGLIVMPMRTMHRHWSDRSISSAGVVLATDGSSGAEQLRQVVNQWPQLLMRSDREIRVLSMRIFDQTFAITHVLRLLTTGVAFVGILSALLALTLERRREFAVLRALGLTPAELRKVLLSQTAWMGVVAGVLALPLGIVMSAILVRVINRRSFGWTMQFDISAVVLWESLALAVVAAMCASVYPAWRLGQMMPSEALRHS